MFNGTKQYIIPSYQRPYSWREKECERLWKDIVEMERKKRPNHFAGLDCASKFSRKTRISSSMSAAETASFMASLLNSHTISFSSSCHLCGIFCQSVNAFRAAADDFRHLPSSHKRTEYLRFFAEKTEEIKCLYGTAAGYAEFHNTHLENFLWVAVFPVG